MQHDKVIKNQSELSYVTEKGEGKVLQEVMKFFRIQESFSGLDILKKRGLAVSTGLMILLLLPFVGIESISKMFRSGFDKEQDFKSKKDSYYSIKNNERIGWRLLVLVLAKRFLHLIKKHELSKEGVKVFVMDDSTETKTGKKIEGIGKVHDHVSQKFVLGFKILLLGYWDGGSFIPIDFSLHREGGKKLQDAKDKVKTVEIKLSNIKLTKKELQDILKQKRRDLKEARQNNNEKGGKTRDRKLLATQKAVTHLEKRLFKMNKELGKTRINLIKAKKNLVQISKEDVFYGLSKKEYAEQYKKNRARNTNGYKRKKELDSSKIENGIKMLKRALKKGFRADYVLTDSWFFCHALLQCVVDMGRSVNLISMAKIGIIKYTEVMSGRSYYPGELISKYSRKAAYCRKLKIHYFKIAATYQGIRINLFFTKMGKVAKWRLLVTTDLGLKIQKLIEIYQIRWGIEIFFKDSKQYLRLGKCQSNNFDAQIADTSLIMIRFMMMSFYKRIHHQKSIGGIFEEWSKKMMEATLAERLWQILIDLLLELSDIEGIDISTLFIEMIRNEKVVEKIQKLPDIFENAQRA